MTELMDLSVTDLAAAIRGGKASPSEAVEAALARAEAGASCNAFITLCAEEARAEAKGAEVRMRDGREVPPLLGVPYSAKDVIPTRGVRTTYGSRLHENDIPSLEALAITRMRNAGAILIGKTTTSEFGHKPLTEAPLFGRTLNPWDARATCGGSSGGAAVAVRTGAGPIALGTDGGGSVRIPAACCGVVGLKATLGVIPHLQAYDLFAANAFIGPLGRSVADVAAAFTALRGGNREDPYGQVRVPDRRARPLADLRAAWLPSGGAKAIDPEVASACEGAVRALAGMGVPVEEVELDFAALAPHFRVMAESNLAAKYAEQAGKESDRFDPGVLAAIQRGLAHSAVDLQRAGAARTALFRRLQALFEKYDLLISPVLTAPALSAEIDPEGPVRIAGTDADDIRAAWYPFTFPLNMTGHPALSLPCGLSRQGLPIGLQIATAWYDEATLFAAAERLEEALPRLPAWGR
jgi:aspartyl-tRNA(Asn)/glutamyl-tRNA(Gln) amidotransferase subunit A